MVCDHGAENEVSIFVFRSGGVEKPEVNGAYILWIETRLRSFFPAEKGVALKAMSCRVNPDREENGRQGRCGTNRNPLPLLVTMQGVDRFATLIL